ncbi:unnamed protein product [Bathycoccus prasinos]
MAPSKKGGKKESKTGAAVRVLDDDEEDKIQVSPEQRKLALEHKSNGNAAFTKKKFYEAASEFTKAIDQDPYDHVFYSGADHGAYDRTNLEACGRAKMRGIETRLCERVLSIRFCLVQVRILPRFYPRVYARAHVGPEELGVDGRHGRSQVGAKEEV